MTTFGKVSQNEVSSEGLKTIESEDKKDEGDNGFERITKIEMLSTTLESNITTSSIKDELITSKTNEEFIEKTSETFIEEGDYFLNFFNY